MNYDYDEKTNQDNNPDKESDSAQNIARIQKLKNAMGRFILDCLADDNISEIALNTDRRIWIDTFDKGWVQTQQKILPGTAKRIIFGIAALASRTIDMDNKPYLEAELRACPGSWPKCRFQAELPDIVESPSFNIRKHTKKILSLQDYVNQGTMTQRQFDIILQGIKKHDNIIAAGGTGSGKTTLLNAILREISHTGDRLVLIEDTPELQCTAPNYVSLKTQKPLINMDELLRISLRISPRRIIVGEVRGKEALTMLKGWNTGHDGGCATLHSDSAVESLYRLEQMISEVSITPQQRTIGQAIDMVIYIKKEGTKRFIKEIIRVNGYNHATQEYDIEAV